MALPDGWVTELVSNRHALRLLGNAVVPLQAATAIGELLHRHETGAVERFGVGIADVALCGVGDEIVQRGDELGAVAVGINGDREGLEHAAECDRPAVNVKGQR